jgi:hypothetical protein
MLATRSKVFPFLVKPLLTGASFSSNLLVFLLQVGLPRPLVVLGFLSLYMPSERGAALFPCLAELLSTPSWLASSSFWWERQCKNSVVSFRKDCGPDSQVLLRSCKNMA